MNAKLLSQATSQLILEQPEKAEEILYKLEKLVKSRYTGIRFGNLVNNITDIIAEKLGINRIKLVTAGQIDSEQINKLKEIWGEKTDIATSVEPNILGGIIIKKDDKQLDLSLKNKLNNLRQSLNSLEETNE